MSLAISFCCLLPFLFPFFALAGPQTTIYLSSSTVSIPSCAQDCVQDFIANGFPASICANRQDLDCLCAYNSTTGFTLGEGALQCVASYCPGELSKYAGVYQYCAGVENAQPETHGTLTATMQVLSATSISSLPSSIPSPTSTISSATINIVTAPPSLPTSISSSSTASSISVDPTPVIYPTPTSASRTFSSTVTPASTSPIATPPSNKPLLTKRAVAGIVVGGVAAATALAFGLMLCILCLRKKRAANNRHSDASFVGDRISYWPLDPPHNTAVTAPSTRPDSQWLDPPVAGQPEMLPMPAPGGEFGLSNLWPRSLEPEEIGVAIAPGLTRASPVNVITYSDSPASAASYQTTERLLPDKPSISHKPSSSYSLYPRPLRINHANRPESGATVFEEDAIIGQRTSTRSSRQVGRGRGSIDTSQAPVQHNLYASASDPFLSPSADSRALTYAKERRQSRTQFPVPPIHTRSPSQPRNGHWTRSPDEIRAPPPAMAALTSPTNNSSKSLPLQRKPTVPSIRSPPPAMAALNSPTKSPSKDLPLKRKPTIAPVRPPLATLPSSNTLPSFTTSTPSSSTNHPSTKPPRDYYNNKTPAKGPPTHLSTASFTSFESGFYDDPFPSPGFDGPPYPSSSSTLFSPPSLATPDPHLPPVREAEEGSAREIRYGRTPRATYAARAALQPSEMAEIRYPRVPGAGVSPLRLRPPGVEGPEGVDTPTRKPVARRRAAVELEGRMVGEVRTAKSLPCLPKCGSNGLASGRKTAKLMILQNPGFAGLEGSLASSARSLEDLRGR